MGPGEEKRCFKCHQASLLMKCQHCGAIFCQHCMAKGYASDAFREVPEYCMKCGSKKLVAIRAG